MLYGLMVFHNSVYLECVDIISSYKNCIGTKKDSKILFWTITSEATKFHSAIVIFKYNNNYIINIISY